MRRRLNKLTTVCGLLPLVILPWVLCCCGDSREKRSQRQDAFVEAAYHGDVVKMRDLMAEGVDLDAHGGFASHYMHPALIQSAGKGHVEAVELLVGSGADVNVRGMHGLTPLMAASASGHQRIVRLLIDKGADVKAADSSGVTALAQASDPRDPHPEVIAVLREAGAR